MNGQHPYTAHVIELPLRARRRHAEDSRRRCCRRTADTAGDYLPLSTREPPAPGHSSSSASAMAGATHTTRATAAASCPTSTAAWACSCRATRRDQAVSPGAQPPSLSRTADDHDARLARCCATCEIGDLVYIPGHVMMAIGARSTATPYVIHDTTGISYRRRRRIERDACDAQCGFGHRRSRRCCTATTRLYRRPHDQHRADSSRYRHGSISQTMKITDIRFGMLRVPLKTPFKTALRTVDTIEDIVIMMHTDTGHIGYGEAPATAVITGDTHGSIIEAIHKIIAPRLIGAGDREPQSHHAADPGRAGEELERQGGGRDRGVRPVRAAVRRAALQDSRRRRSGDHHRHHDQRRLRSTRWSRTRSPRSNAASNR